MRRDALAETPTVEKTPEHGLKSQIVLGEMIETYGSSEPSILDTNQH